MSFDRSISLRSRFPCVLSLLASFSCYMSRPLLAHADACSGSALDCGLCAPRECFFLSRRRGYAESKQITQRSVYQRRCRIFPPFSVVVLRPSLQQENSPSETVFSSKRFVSLGSVLQSLTRTQRSNFCIPLHGLRDPCHVSPSRCLTAVTGQISVRITLWLSLGLDALLRDPDTLQ